MFTSRVFRSLKNFYSIPFYSSINRKNAFATKDQIVFELKSINDTHATLIIDGKEFKYDWMFLRDSCQCSKCVDASSRQKFHRTTDVPFNISPKNNGIRILDNNLLEIIWNQSLIDQKQENDIHRSLYSSTWLRTYSTAENIASARYNNCPYVLWNRNDIEKINLQINCNDYLHSDKEFYRTLKCLNDYGIAFINNVQGESTIERLVERIGEIYHTFYGKTWDVRSVPNATNVAYTSQHLGLHMDLLYFEAPPGLQFLHSLANNVIGGASYFADSFRAAEILRQNDPESFNILCSYPVTFHYKNVGRHFHFTRTTFVLDKFSLDNRIDHVNYAPPFQAPFESDTSKPDFRRFIRALKAFQDIIEDKNNQLELILKQDQCVIFNNRRTLHARREFDPSSGNRWLKGSYTQLDNFRDRLRIYREKYDNIQNLQL